MNDVPIPETMKRLDLDARGLPIPYIVMRGDNGEAHFVVNDTRKVHDAAINNKCHICGQPLKNTRWFIGGPLSAFHPQGGYNDGPMHDECAHYALKVCPWLAVPHYGKSITDAASKRVQGDVTIVDHTSMPGRPVLFVAVRCKGHQIEVQPGPMPRMVFKPNRPYLKAEFWQHGQQLDDTVGKFLAKNALSRPIQAPEPPRIVKS